MRLRVNYWLGGIIGLQALIVVLYLQRFPDFPQFPSSDFISHVRIAKDLSHSFTLMQSGIVSLPPISQTFLYYGVEAYLALSILLLRVEPLFAVRYAMALLVVLSPVVFYVTARALSDSKRMALLASFFYTVSGFVWFGYVFNAGLFPNFLGILASLLLISSVVNFISKRLGLINALSLMASLMLALFSHYSILLVFPSLAAVLAWRAAKSKALRKNSLIALAVLISPASALLVYPSLVAQLLAFLSSSGGNLPSLTPLARLMPLPSLAYMVAEIAPPDPFRTDVAAVNVFILLLSFACFAYKKRDYRLSILGLWFLTAIVASPLNATAWRFAIVALVPLTIMAAFGLHFLVSSTVRRFNWKHVWRTEFRSAKHFAVFILIGGLLIPSTLLSSWGVASTGLSLSADSQAYAASDVAVYETIQWLKQHSTGCGPQQDSICVFASATDWRFTYSDLMGGPFVHLLTPILATPDVVLHDAASNGAEYVIVTTTQNMRQFESPSATDPFECTNPGGQIISISVLNSTIKDSFKLAVRMDPQINGSVTFFMDGQRYGSILLRDGRSTATLVQIPPGQHDIRVRYQFGGSNVITIFANESKPSIDYGQHSYCSPWWFFGDDMGPNSRIVYQIPNEVKIWCIRSNYCAKE